MSEDRAARQSIIDACLAMNVSGLNQGTSGNISLRLGDQMLITPSATPYEDLTPEMIAAIDLNGAMTGAWQGPLKPSTEWRIHWLLQKQRPDLTAVVHAHPTYCTAFSMLREGLPAAHYMVAAFGGLDVPCTGFRTFGSPELAALVVEAMQDRSACLLANHGMVAAGTGLAQALWRAKELETLARQYAIARQLGDPVILSADDMAETFTMFADYGVQGD